MITSDLESFVLKWLLAAIIEAGSRRALTDEDMVNVDALSAWMRSPGITPRAQAEIDCGMPVRVTTDSPKDEWVVVDMTTWSRRDQR